MNNKEKLKLKNISVIINPISGTKNKDHLADFIKNYFEKKDVALTIKYTQKAGDALVFAQEFISENKDIIIIVGGDGTVNEAINGISNSGIPIGIIPMGSGNGFARHLGLTSDVKKSLDIIFDGYFQAIDVMTVNGKYSVNVSGVGFDALVAYRFRKFAKRGFWSYFKIIISEFIAFKPQLFSITIDGQTIEKQAYIISFANSSQFGNNAFISPKASVSDGVFDLSIIKPFSKWLMPMFAINLMLGTLRNGKYLEIIKVKELTLTQTVDYYQVDGDFFEGTNVLNVKILPRMLNVIIPKNKLNKI